MQSFLQVNKITDHEEKREGQEEELFFVEGGFRDSNTLSMMVVHEDKVSCYTVNRYINTYTQTMIMLTNSYYLRVQLNSDFCVFELFTIL